eukprot:6189251-Amphidinium_carterae.1
MFPKLGNQTQISMTFPHIMFLNINCTVGGNGRDTISVAVASTPRVQQRCTILRWAQDNAIKQAYTWSHLFEAVQQDNCLQRMKGLLASCPSFLFWLSKV